MRSSFAFHKSNRNEEVFQYVGHAENAGSNQQYAAGGTCKDCRGSAGGIRPSIYGRRRWHRLQWVQFRLKMQPRAAVLLFGVLCFGTFFYIVGKSFFCDKRFLCRNKMGKALRKICDLVSLVLVLHPVINRSRPWVGFLHGCVIVSQQRQAICVLCLALQKSRSKSESDS